MTTQFDQISQETLEEIKKSLTSGVLTATGLVGFDLSGVVSLVPVNTPIYNRFARKSGDGSQAANWKALLNVNNAQPNPFTGKDQGGNLVKFSEIDVLAPYLPVRVSGEVTRDAVAYGKGYADAKAIASTGTLMQWRIQDNKAIIGGQNWALPAISQPTVTQSDTGGTIAASTAVNVKVAARSAYNYYWGGSGIASAQGTVTTSTVAAATHSATATVPAVKGAVAYDWYVGGFYYTTTVVNKVTITSIPTANQTVPSLPDLYTTAPTAVPTADTSFSTNAYNGLLATTLGDYSANGPLVTPGSGTSSGAAWTSLDGGTLTASAQGVAEIDAMLLSIYNSAQLSPTAMVMNAQHANDLSLKVLGTNSAVTYLTGNDPSRRDLTVGGVAARYINRASGGDPVEIVVDPHFPQGTIQFITERVPYPNSGIANTFEVRTLQDVMQFDYGAQLDPTPGNNGGPREVWDQSSIETLVNRAPVACGVLSNVGNG